MRIAAQRPARRAEQRSLAVLMLSAGLPVLSGTTLSVALPAVADGLQTTAAAAVGIVAVYFAAQALTQPFTGMVADAMGSQRATRWGLGLLGAGSLAAAVSPALSLLLAARAVQAVGVALILPGVHAALAARPERDAGRFAWLNVVGNLTAAVGPLLGGLIVAWAGWRGVFMTTMVLSAAAALTLTLGSEHSRVRLGPRPKTSLTDVLADHRMVTATAVNALDNLVLQTVLLGVPFAVITLGAPSTARALAVFTIAGAVAAPFGGLLAARVGRAVSARIGFVTAAVGLLVLSQVSGRPAAGATLAALSVVGVGLGLEIPSVQSAPLACVHPSSRATAAGLAATARQVGSLGGAVLVAVVVATDPAAVFAVGAAGAMIAAVLSRRLG